MPFPGFKFQKFSGGMPPDPPSYAGPRILLQSDFKLDPPLYKLQYNPQSSKPKPRSRSINVIWFNPLYNSTVSTNIGYKFLQAIDDCFPSHHPLHKIFNRNTLKLSYSCMPMPNVKCVMSSHNKSIINKQMNTVTD